MVEALTPVLERIDRDFPASVERLRALLTIPSVGTDPAHDADTRRAATWLVERLAAIGFKASLRETAGQPMVVAHAIDAPEDAPHILYYGHYDVQPPDPLELWESPPFAPVIVDGPRGKRIVARGAVDDKGQVMTFIEALAAWHEVHGRFPVRITVFLEGEEENGSKSLEPFLAANAEELKADICMISDTGMLAVYRPAITYMLRGLAYFEVTLHGPSHDLHSGLYGGAVPNPINRLTQILGQLHDDRGRVRLPGFYDDVVELSPQEAGAWRAIGFDDAAFLREVGLSSSAGEEGYTVLERVWARPTCDINGIWGGYMGEGAKTVIPSHASAKLSCRLVPDQDPQQVAAALRQFFERLTPPGCRIEIKEMGVSPGIRIPTDSPFLAAAQAALARAFSVPATLIGSGGSIPVVGSMKRLLGLDSLLVGFGLDDDRLHSPNEKFELICYRKGIETHAAFLYEAAQIGGRR